MAKKGDRYSVLEAKLISYLHSNGYSYSEIRKETEKITGKEPCDTTIARHRDRDVSDVENLEELKNRIKSGEKKKKDKKGESKGKSVENKKKEESEKSKEKKRKGHEVKEVGSMEVKAEDTRSQKRKKKSESKNLENIEVEHDGKKFLPLGKISLKELGEKWEKARKRAMEDGAKYIDKERNVYDENFERMD